MKTSGSSQSLTAGKAENVSCLHVRKQNILFLSAEFMVLIWCVTKNKHFMFQFPCILS